nr:AraC family transcriptional regulator [Halocynthiibacter namhaensis]
MTYLEPTRNADLHLITPVIQQNHTQEIIVILPDGTSPAAAQMVDDLFTMANDLIPGSPYQVSFRPLSAPIDRDPRRWRRRSYIFMGDLQSRWDVTDIQRKRLQQILHLSPRTLLIGGAVFLPVSCGFGNQHSLAIHPNFMAAATEENLHTATPGTQTARSGTIASAVSSFAALPLFLEMIQHDQGHFISDAVAQYLGMAKNRTNPSKVFLNLQRLSCDDPLIVNTLNTMQSNIETPLRIRELAEIAGVSTRQLERRFQEKNQRKPPARLSVAAVGKSIAAAATHQHVTARNRHRHRVWHPLQPDPLVHACLQLQPQSHARRGLFWRLPPRVRLSARSWPSRQTCNQCDIPAICTDIIITCLGHHG